MKYKRKWPYGLRAKFILSMVISGLICIVVFMGLYILSDSILTDLFEESSFEQWHISRQADNLQAFVVKNGISTQSLSDLKKWEKRQPIILLEMYGDEGRIYSSFDAAVTTEKAEQLPVMENAAVIQLADSSVTAVLYSDFTYQYYMLGTAVSFALALALFVVMFLHSNRKLIEYICKLNDEVQILEGGNLEYEVSVQGNDEITDLAESMNRMRLAFQNQIKTEQRLHNAQRQLVTQMSHDLRTPLTGIMLYLEILRSKRYRSEEELQNYLKKMDAKAHHLKLLSDHLFEYTLEGTPPSQMLPVTMEEAFGEVIKVFCEELQVRGFSSSLNLQWEPVFVQVNQEYLQRIMENILSNLAKYADRTMAVQIETVLEEKNCGFAVMNACGLDSYAESNGIGIEGIRTMMQQMGGCCMVEQTERIFQLVLFFPKQ